MATPNVLSSWLGMRRRAETGDAKGKQAYIIKIRNYNIIIIRNYNNFKSQIKEKM